MMPYKEKCGITFHKPAELSASMWIIIQYGVDSLSLHQYMLPFSCNKFMWNLISPYGLNHLIHAQFDGGSFLVDIGWTFSFVF